MNRGLALRLVLLAFTLVLLVWFLVGCATTKWSHPTAGDQQFKVDDSECSEQAARSMGVGYPRRAGPLADIGGSMRLNQAYEKCLRDKGWVKQ